MKAVTTAILLAAATSFSTLAIAPEALARAKPFSSSLQTPNTPVAIKVKLSEDLQYRANNLSKKLRDKSNSRGINNGFSGNGYFGERALDRLTKRLEKRMADRLAKQGIEVSDNAPTVLEITIIDARPNRPTFRQLSKSPGLSFDSVAIGGAEFAAKLSGPAGDLGEAKYKWFETDIRYSQYGGIWTDANRAIDRFARKTAKALAKTQ